MLTKDIWDSLATPAGKAGAGFVLRRLIPQSKFNAFAAVDESTGRRLLLLKSNQANVRPAQPLPSGRGFEVQFLVTPTDPEGSNCLRLQLTEPADADVFDVIGNDILANIVQSTNDKVAFDAFVARIVVWQRFLDELPVNGLTEQSQLGLFGELWFLRQVLLPEIGPMRAVTAWAGPMKLTKDFQLAGLAFEVKASGAKQHTSFAISSEVQLDSQGVGRLILYGLVVERLAAGGMSLLELVGAVRADLRANPAASVRFSELLLQLGYTDQDAARFTSRFAFRSQHFFDVTGDFPRIVGTDLRAGVGDVRYSIMESECEHYSVTEAEARNLIQSALP